MIQGKFVKAENQRPLKKLLLITFNLALLVSYVLSVSAATIQAPTQYLTIQSAIDVANDGDVIMVEPGTYYEEIDFSGKAITVKGISAEGEESPIIDGGRGKVAVIRFKKGEGNDSILSGFTIINGKDSGIYCAYGSSPTITHCSISHNYASRGGGIHCYQSSSPIIINCLIHHNLANKGAGIYCQYSSQPIIKIVL